MPTTGGGGAQNISSSQITDDTIANADVNSAANIALSKINALNQIDNDELADDVINNIIVNLSSAQIKAIVATPPTLIAAPGAGKVIQILNSFWSYTRITLDYVGGEQYSFVYDGSITGENLSTVNASQFFTATTNITTTRLVGALLKDQALTENKAIKLYNVGGATELTLGSGTAKLQIQYRIITL